MVPPRTFLIISIIETVPPPSQPSPAFRVAPVRLKIRFKNNLNITFKQFKIYNCNQTKPKAFKFISPVEESNI